MAGPKLSDIAKRAGVSVAAASIALNDSQTKRVSAGKRDLILKIAKEMGYAPNEVARALAERRTRLVGLMVPLRDPIFFNQFIAQALSGIQSSLSRRGYNLLVYSPKGKPGRETRDQIVENKFTDGLIFINTRLCSPSDVKTTIRELDAAQIKFTMINSYHGRAAINYVGVDDFAIGSAAANYLVERGHKKIAFLSGLNTLSTHIQLLAGQQKALASHELEIAKEAIGCTGYEQQEAFRILDHWFASRRRRPSAIFCGDDQLLTYLYNWVEARGMRVPEELSILARGNAETISLLRPRPTAFCIPTFQMGETAADMLIDLIEDPQRERKRVFLPFHFLEGQTV